MTVTHTLVDTNVLVDVIDADPVWMDWSRDALEVAGKSGHLMVNQVIYGELSVGFPSITALDEALGEADILKVEMPWSAAYLAGKAFLDYRRRGGKKTVPLPDFFIGAHAAVQKYRLLTRDAARYRTYFPTVDIVAP
ncbi:MAG: type II toxin-antitoxin system VapC family toxin [Mycobacterium sp.]|nr:type II toxin-antitoxin system VapC family toxin [Mycobacterium sp.]